MRGEGYICQPEEEIKVKGAGRAYLNKKEKFVYAYRTAKQRMT